MSFSFITSPPSRAKLTNTDTLPTTNAQAEVEFGKTVDALQVLDETCQALASRGGFYAGAFRNLVLSANGASANVSVSADAVVVENSTHDPLTLRAVSLTINTAGSGANGLDTGSLATNTWYAVWLIWNGTTAAGLVSLSSTGPTLPTGYTYKARIGWIVTDGTGNKYPVSFRQCGREVQYVVAAGTNMTALPIAKSGVQGNVSIPSYVSASLTSYVPSTACKVHLQVFSSSTGNILIAPNNSYGGYGATTNRPPLTWGLSSGGDVSFVGSMLLESSNIYYTSSMSTSGVAVMGWEDNL